MHPEDNIHDFAVTENDLYLYTPENASRFKVVKTSLQDPDIQHAETVIAEDPEAMLTSFALTSNALYYTQSLNGVEAKLFRKKIQHSQTRRTQSAVQGWNDTPLLERIPLSTISGSL